MLMMPFCLDYTKITKLNIMRLGRCVEHRGKEKKLEILVLSLSFFKTSDAIIFLNCGERKKIKCIFSKKNKL